MSDIRTEIGGSKSTLWNYFSSKEDLFAAVMKTATDRMTGQIRALARIEGDARGSLERFCSAYIQTIVSDEAIAMHRLVIGEVHRFPQIGQTFFGDAVETVWLIVADFLRQLFPDNDRIDRAPADAAELLTSLCHGRSFLRRIYGVGDQPAPDDIEDDTHVAVTTFLRALAIPEYHAR